MVICVEFTAYIILQQQHISMPQNVSEHGVGTVTTRNQDLNSENGVRTVNTRQQNLKLELGVRTVTTRKQNLSLERGVRTVNTRKQNLKVLNISDINKIHQSPLQSYFNVRKAMRENYKRDYYKLRTEKTDHCDFHFLVEGASICEENVPFVLIIVPSIPDHQYNRHTIRQTWGQFARNKTLSRQLGYKLVKLAFLLGRWTDNQTRHAVIQENMQYGDIVVGDFEDSYKNLTRKILFGLKWMSTYCAEADYILKVDEDIYVHIPKLVAILARTPCKTKGCIYGHLYSGGPVVRGGRWAVSTEEFPMSKYPPYMSGNSYVIAGATAPKLLNISQYLPYLPIEDAFITGILPKIIKISQINIAGFTDWSKAAPDHCTFFFKNNISGNKVNPGLMVDMWRTQNKLPLSCGNKTLV